MNLSPISPLHSILLTSVLRTPPFSGIQRENQKHLLCATSLSSPPPLFA